MKLLIEILFVCLIYETVVRQEGSNTNHSNGEMYGNLRLFVWLLSLSLIPLSPLYSHVKCLVLWRKNRNECFLITIMCVCMFCIVKTFIFMLIAENPIFRSWMSFISPPEIPSLCFLNLFFARGKLTNWVFSLLSLFRSHKYTSLCWI